MFDFDFQAKLYARIHAHKILKHEIIETLVEGKNKKALIVEVAGNLIFADGDDVMIQDHETRTFSVILRGKKSFLINQIELAPFSFFENDKSKALREELAQLCEKYFPVEQEKTEEV